MYEEGQPLIEIAQEFENLGWQIVPAQWHKNRKGKMALTPLPGMTGAVPFKTAKDACPPNLWLALDPIDAVERSAKVAIRPPTNVVGLDVDHGYSGKNGGDTLVNAEMQYGPLPATYSLTARGPYSPSRRMWFRIPDGLQVPDSFFGQFGGYIETVRTEHRFSWAAPGLHIKTLKEILWYDEDHVVCEMPSIDDLGELPASWVRAIEQFNEVKPLQTSTDFSGAAENMPTTLAANGLVKATHQLYSLHPTGGEFRNAVFRLGFNVGRVNASIGRDKDSAVEEAIRLLELHPQIDTADADDLQWINEGIIKGYNSGWRHKDEKEREDVPAASRDQLLAFLNSFTRCDDPKRLGRRKAWMKSANNDQEFFRHACALVDDAMHGYYPAAECLTAVRDIFTSLGKEDLYDLLCRALGNSLYGERA